MVAIYMSSLSHDFRDLMMTYSDRPNHARLFQLAAGQHGYFTSAQAAHLGFIREALRRHTASGRFIRIRRGLYRLRDYPPEPHEEIVAAWLAAGGEPAVVSHESALDLYDLSDVIPNGVHITMPREKRYWKGMPGVIRHTTTRSFQQNDLMQREGVPITSPTRSILDAAEYGTGPEQIEMAVQQALQRGLADRSELLHDAERYDSRVQQLVRRAVDRAAQ